MFQYELRLVITQNHLSFVFSFLFHLGLILTLPSMSFMKWAKLGVNIGKDDKEVFEIQLADGADIEKIKLALKGEMRAKNPYFYLIFKNRKKENDELPLPEGLDAIMAKLSGQNIQNKPLKFVQKSQVLKINDSESKKENKLDLSNIDWSKTLERKKSENAEPSELKVAEDLKKIMSGNYSNYRSCYEKALLSDEFLAGNISIELDLLRKGKLNAAQIQFKGVGKDSSIQMLKTCLREIGERLEVPEKFKGKKIKFSLFFNK